MYVLNTLLQCYLCNLHPVQIINSHERRAQFNEFMARNSEFLFLKLSPNILNDLRILTLYGLPIFLLLAHDQRLENTKSYII